jgi:ATP-binding cassette subfamily B protein
MANSTGGTKGTRRSVLRHLRPGRRSAVALAAATAATVLPLGAPQITRRFVDDPMGGAGTRHLTLIALGYLGLAVAGQVARMGAAPRRCVWCHTGNRRSNEPIR